MPRIFLSYARPNAAHAKRAVDALIADGAEVRAEADFGRTHGKLVQATLDGDLPPMPFNQIQCVKLSDWKGNADHPEWRKLLNGVPAVTDREHQSIREAAP